MLPHLPYHITIVFIITTLATLVLMMLAMFTSSNEWVKRRANLFSMLLLMWLIFQSTLSLNGWYIERKSIPPHIAFPVVTFSVIIITLFVTKAGRKFLDALNMHWLVWLHIVRLLVEICLWWLAAERQVPQSMTFEGHNFDIVFGITAPFVVWLYFHKQRMSRSLFALWNVLGIVSLFVIVITAAGAAPTALQAWNFTHPNYAVLHFPFVWLPAFIVPCVLLAHLQVLRALLKKS
ncbi:MAG: hypothetical protein ACKVOR_09140 [Flavobacteriales bacterium]